MQVTRRSSRQLVGALLLFFCYLCWPRVSPAQSRRLQRLWAELARQSPPGLARERALWALAWEKELPIARQDSLATAATRLAAQLRDSTGLLAGRVADARHLLAGGQQRAAQRQLLPVLAAARRRHDAWLEIITLLTLGRSYWNTAEHARAMPYWQQAWVAAQHQPDLYWRARTAVQQGNSETNGAPGMTWFFRGLQLATQADCQTCQADALGNIGYNYLLLDELPLAAHFAQRELRLRQQIRDRPGEQRTLSLLAELHLKRRQFAAVAADLRRAGALATTAADSLWVLMDGADAAAQQGQTVLARQQAHRGLRLAQRLGSRDALANLEATLANTFLRQGQLDSALWYGRRAYARRQRGAERQVLATTCQVLAQAYAARQDFGQAYLFLGRAQAYRDTLSNDKIRAQAAQARYSYELEKQQRQIAQLERDRALGRLQHQQQLVLGGLGGLLLLAAGGGVLWAVRRRQHRRVAALREQIAADLHDEVGGLLTQLALEGATLRQTQPTTPTQARHLDRVAEVSQQAARQLRDVVWSIDTRHDSLAALLDHLRDYLHELLGTTDLEAEFAADPDLAARPLPLPVRDALYFVFKEALHNVLKHADARQVRAQLRLAGSTQLELTIDDDGRGLPPATLDLPTRGLGNMRRRAQAAGGQLVLGPSALGGLRVQLRLPLR